jgi:hypothetical protein
MSDSHAKVVLQGYAGLENSCYSPGLLSPLRHG